MKKSETESSLSRKRRASRIIGRLSRRIDAKTAAAITLLTERIEEERSKIGPLTGSELRSPEKIRQTAELEKMINEFLRLSLGKNIKPRCGQKPLSPPENNGK